MLALLIKLVWPFFWVFVVLFFKNEIKSLFSAITGIGNRSKKISCMGWVDIDLGTNPDLPIGSQQQLESKQQNLTKAFQSPIITNEENIIRSQLVDAGFKNEQAIDLLIQHLAYSNLLIGLLVIDRLIFPEQVKLLSYLNSQAKPIPESQLINFYTEWKEKNKDADYTYQQFLKFLFDQRLILSQIDGYTVTPMSKEYLSFLIKIGRPV